ncbi:MAG TPA: hypothetical protein VK879_17605 [Candidatus Sulfomarinibacteraceae bacterium]|nr:hypothetical protein [Candidatus Sulfomarinibacteraceae bacterium]
MRRRLIVLAVGGLLFLLASGALIQAQSGGGYDLSWFTIDGGGGSSSSSSYTVSGTIGQADAGALASGSYKLEGGFWNSGVAGPAQTSLFLPLVVDE